MLRTPNDAAGAQHRQVDTFGSPWLMAQAPIRGRCMRNECMGRSERESAQPPPPLHVAVGVALRSALCSARSSHKLRRRQLCERCRCIWEERDRCERCTFATMLRSFCSGPRQSSRAQEAVALVPLQQEQRASRRRTPPMSRPERGPSNGSRHGRRAVAAAACTVHRTLLCCALLLSRAPQRRIIGAAATVFLFRIPPNCRRANRRSRNTCTKHCKTTTDSYTKQHTSVTLPKS